MTVHLSNLQVNVLRLFARKDTALTYDEFRALDQRITSSLGRRRVALIERRGRNSFILTSEGLHALRMFERTDVYRKLATFKIASVYERSGHRRAQAA